MSLPWVRFDTALPDNPKILTLIAMKDGHRAAFVYCCGLAYSGKQGTDGFLPTEAIPRINGRAVDAARLTDVGLWRQVPGGWLINGWDEKQESTVETKARRVKAQTAAAARWEKHDKLKAVE